MMAELNKTDSFDEMWLTKKLEIEESLHVAQAVSRHKASQNGYDEGTMQCMHKTCSNLVHAGGKEGKVTKAFDNSMISINRLNNLNRDYANRPFAAQKEWDEQFCIDKRFMVGGRKLSLEYLEYNPMGSSYIRCDGVNKILQSVCVCQKHQVMDKSSAASEERAKEVTAELLDGLKVELNRRLTILEGRPRPRSCSSRF